MPTGLPTGLLPPRALCGLGQEGGASGGAVRAFGTERHCPPVPPAPAPGRPPAGRGHPGCRTLTWVPGRVVPGFLQPGVGEGLSGGGGGGARKPPEAGVCSWQTGSSKGDLSLLTLCLPRQDPDPFPHRKPGKLGGGREGIPWAGQEAGLPVGLQRVGWGRVSQLREAPPRGRGEGGPGGLVSQPTLCFRTLRPRDY